MAEKNIAKIEKNSSNNIISQGNTVNNYFFNTEEDTIRTLGQMGCYDIIQQRTQAMMMAAKESHPLYPLFGVRYDNKLERLVSTPETKDALKRYPKIIKGKFVVDYVKYPHMDKRETPWDYAYRTQTNVELQTTAYKEYLGDIEDAFPVMQYHDGMITVIGAPEFPPAKEMEIVSGDIAISVLMRRKPCLEYGKILFETIDDANALKIKIIIQADLKKTYLTLSKLFVNNLDVMLKRERLINAIAHTKRFLIREGDATALEVIVTEEQRKAFIPAKIAVGFFENLQSIERFLGCKFNLSNMTEITAKEFDAAQLLASSLVGKWYRVNSQFDDTVHIDYNAIPDDIVRAARDASNLTVESVGVRVNLCGLVFTAEKYRVLYENAKINNIDSVVRNKRLRKKNILLTFKPINGKGYFYKYSILEKISVTDHI